MSNLKYNLKYPEYYYLHYDPDAGSKGDTGISYQRMKIVKTKKNHECMFFIGYHDIPSGSLALRETAIVEGMGWKSCYFCINCLDKWFNENY